MLMVVMVLQLPEVFTTTIMGQEIVYSGVYYSYGEEHTYGDVQVQTLTIGGGGFPSDDQYPTTEVSAEAESICCYYFFCCLLLLTPKSQTLLKTLLNPLLLQLVAPLLVVMTLVVLKIPNLLNKSWMLTTKTC